MRTLHILSPGSSLRLDGNRLEVWQDGQRIGTAMAGTIESVVIHGAVQLTAAVINHLLGVGVPCVFLTQDGRLKGRLEPVGHPAARLRGAQALAAATPGRRLAIARQVARNKLASQIRVLRALGLGDTEILRRLEPRLMASERIDELRGLEGWASRIYFGLLRDHFGLGPWKRQHHPPPDPLNALLSYGYALLLRPAWMATATVGLDPYQGFLHEATRAQPALVLDLVEEFRAPLIDFTVFPLWHRTLRTSQGWWEPADRGGVRLTLDTRRTLITAFERRLQRRTRYAPTGRREQVATLFELQARAVGHAIRSGRALRPAWRG